MEKIYAPYVLYKNLDGFYNETKLLKEINFEELLKNKSVIESYYGDEIKVESINGIFEDNKVIFIENNSPVLVSVEDVIKETTKTFISLLSECINAKYMDYKRYEEDLSFEDKIVLILKNFNVEIDINNKIDFNEDKYLNLAKKLSHYCQIYINEVKFQNYLKEVCKVTQIVNTFLAQNETLNILPKDAHHRSFNIDEVENSSGVREYYFKNSENSLYDHINFYTLKLMNKVDNKIKNKM